MARERYKECSRKYKKGETQLANVELALRGALRHHTELELSKIGSLSIDEIRAILRGQQTLSL